jgi:tRNA dimethylallyltransferase
VVIVGATATGKSQLAMTLATQYLGQIISADSRQVYQHMDIGTAKPTVTDRQLVSHHLVDIIAPDVAFGLQQFISLESIAYQNVNNQNMLPFLVGGTGQYVWAVLEGWRIPEVPPDENSRRSLEALVEKSGVDKVFEILESIDPKAANRVDRQNPRRVIRAIEVATYRKQHPGPRKIDPEIDSLVIGLRMNRERLYSRIDRRVDEMVSAGWLNEVRNLLDLGYDDSLPAMSGVGYAELSSCLNGDLSLDEAIAKIKVRTHRYARQQHAWFKAIDPRIHWIDAEDELDLADGILQKWLNSSR